MHGEPSTRPMEASLDRRFGDVQGLADFPYRQPFCHPHPDWSFQRRIKLVHCAQYLDSTLLQVAGLFRIRSKVLDFEAGYVSCSTRLRIKQYLGTSTPFTKYQQGRVNSNLGQP